MIQETRNALTVSNCTTALDLSTRLFQSSYSDNNIRMLYASSHACNVGIALYTLIDDITASDFTSQDAIFKTLVRLFPSKAATDTKLESSMYAQDALQSILVGGTVLGASNQFYATAANLASVLPRDRTDDANIYLAFTSMGLVGNALNRFGFTAAQDPVSFGYSQQQTLVTTWPTYASIKADASGQGCALASGLLNMLDGITVLTQQAPGSVADALSLVTTNLSAAVDAAAHFRCDPVSNATDCTAALLRLRYRDSCKETSDTMAASALGILEMIDLGWN